jgi:hypothetical protein
VQIISKESYTTEKATIAFKEAVKASITKTVIGIPANYTEAKKDAIRAAAATAEFEEVRLLFCMLCAARYVLLFNANDCANGDTTFNPTLLRVSLNLRCI